MQSIAREVAYLRQMRVAELQSKYAELFGETCSVGADVFAWVLPRVRALSGEHLCDPNRCERCGEVVESGEDE